MTSVVSAPDLQARYDEATHRAVEILKKANPVLIIRFGSAASGLLHEDSDLDLCVIVERTDERSIRQLRRDLNRLLWKHYRPYDLEIQLHVYYRDTFEDYLRRMDPFLHEVIKGEVVYEASGESPELLKESSETYGPSRYGELAQVWLETATQDLSYAKSARESGFYSHACFSCQQAVEKALKAYLLARRKSLIRTHNLVRLLDECTWLDESFKDLGEACLTLNEYYADTRYPDTLRFGQAFTPGEVERALSFTQEVLELVSLRINELPNGEAE
ncbi:MAG: hypothetical protein Kow0063_23190 [Anaerolineae bacterium]